MNRMIQWVMVVILAFGTMVQTSCSNHDDDTVQNDDPVRIGIAWRGDSTSTSYTSTLQSVREAGAVPVPLPLLKSPFMDYDNALCYFRALVKQAKSKTKQ